MKLNSDSVFSKKKIATPIPLRLRRKIQSSCSDPNPAPVVDHLWYNVSVG